MTERFYMSEGGGLGDLMDSYLGRVREWGYFQDVKEKHPDCKIRVVLCIHNEQSRDFLEANPYIDELIWKPYMHDGSPVYDAFRGDFVNISQALKLRQYTYNTPQIYLTEADKLIVDPIIAAGDYVFMHPFAGEHRRTWSSHYEIKNFIDALIDAGQKVVVVGGTYERTSYLDSKLGDDLNKGVIEEVLDYEREGLFNLVGKCNARIAAYLTQKASRFIGTHSCYVLVAWRAGIPTLCVAPNWMESHFQNHDNSCWGFEKGLPLNTLVFYDQVDKEGVGINTVINEWLQNPHLPSFNRALNP